MTVSIAAFLISTFVFLTCLAVMARLYSKTRLDWASFEFGKERAERDTLEGVIAEVTHQINTHMRLLSADAKAKDYTYGTAKHRLQRQLDAFGIKLSELRLHDAVVMILEDATREFESNKKFGLACWGGGTVEDPQEIAEDVNECLPEDPPPSEQEDTKGEPIDLFGMLNDVITSLEAQGVINRHTDERGTEYTGSPSKVEVLPSNIGSPHFAPPGSPQPRDTFSFSTAGQEKEDQPRNLTVLELEILDVVGEKTPITRKGLLDCGFTQKDLRVVENLVKEGLIEKDRSTVDERVILYSSPQ